VIASADDAPSMRAIAAEAGVGIATLYRHFPTRESLAAALRQWMDLFGGWVATKNGMLDTLLAMIKAGEIAHAQTRTELLDAITEILHAGRAAGDLRADVTAEDIAASLLGIFTVAPLPKHADRAAKLLNILMDGLRPPN
jgi:AcrR family transcriptional regulator